VNCHIPPLRLVPLFAVAADRISPHSPRSSPFPYIQYINPTHRSRQLHLRSAIPSSHYPSSHTSSLPTRVLHHTPAFKPVDASRGSDQPICHLFPPFPLLSKDRILCFSVIVSYLFAHWFAPASPHSHPGPSPHYPSVSDHYFHVVGNLVSESITPTIQKTYADVQICSLGHHRCPASCSQTFTSMHP
jgi:hypothetical protein